MITTRVDIWAGLTGVRYQNSKVAQVITEPLQYKHDASNDIIGPAEVNPAPVTTTIPPSPKIVNNVVTVDFTRK